MFFNPVVVRVSIVAVEEVGAFVLVTVTGKDEVDAVVFKNGKVRAA